MAPGCRRPHPLTRHTDPAPRARRPPAAARGAAPARPIRKRRRTAGPPRSPPRRGRPAQLRAERAGRRAAALGALPWQAHRFPSACCPSPPACARLPAAPRTDQNVPPLRLARCHVRQRWDVPHVLHLQLHPGRAASAGARRRSFTRLCRGAARPRAGRVCPRRRHVSVGGKEGAVDVVRQPQQQPAAAAAAAAAFARRAPRGNQLVRPAVHGRRAPPAAARCGPAPCRRGRFEHKQAHVARGLAPAGAEAIGAGLLVNVSPLLRRRRACFLGGLGLGR
jgi:hypothetical protein